MQLGFLGTPDFAAVVLDALISSPHDVRVVFTQPDRGAGRGRRVQPSPVRVLADASDIPVLTPTRLAGEVDHVRDLDLLVVAAYGLILPKAFLEAPPLGTVNVHASLLPRWRGAAPVEHALIEGDTETGVSIMQVEPSLDAGPVFLTRTTLIQPTDTGISITERLAELGAAALLEVLVDYAERTPTPQDETCATYAPKLDNAIARIDWQKDALQIERLIRALTGRQTAYTTTGDLRMRILSARIDPGNVDRSPGTLMTSDGSWSIATGSGQLVPDVVQLNRGKGTPQPFKNLINGYSSVLYDGLVFDAPG